MIMQILRSQPSAQELPAALTMDLLKQNLSPFQGHVSNAMSSELAHSWHGMPRCSILLTVPDESGAIALWRIDRQRSDAPLQCKVEYVDDCRGNSLENVYDGLFPGR